MIRGEGIIRSLFVFVDRTVVLSMRSTGGSERWYGSAIGSRTGPPGRQE